MTAPGEEMTTSNTDVLTAEAARAPVYTTARLTRRRRRPSGAAPPLPRSIGVTGKAWLAVLALLIVGVIVSLNVAAVRRAIDRADAKVLRQMARLRAGWLTDVVNPIDHALAGWPLGVAAVLMVIALIGLRRWRHLFTYLGAMAVLALVGEQLYGVFARPRPYGVTTIGRWAGFSMPSPPVAVLALFLTAVAYSLVVAGRPRTIAKGVIAFAVVLFAGCRLYLGVDHLSDIVVGVTLAIAVGVNAFRVFTPNESFPVAYRAGKTAHLDVGGRRGDAIRQAISDQLGFTVVDIKPVGLEGSGGSTPLRIRVVGDPDTYLFGKLYAMSHVRADRWYKLGRTILYGRLEDEAPFQSVRRLVEYEDYTLRLLTDLGLPTAAPFGIVEITPEREYLLVTEFFQGATEIGEADVDDAVIDEGLRIVRGMWDAGLAHRDIKPANLLVRDGRVLVIDVAFVQVRPSPWRQAVDLANMMLVLAVRADAERVYNRALQFFTPDEIAEAFAATRGVASPSQLRAFMKRDGRDLLEQFRSLGPPRRPITLQRWSFRRLGLALAVVLIGLLALSNTKDLLEPAQDIGVTGTPSCGTGNLMILIAQSTPAATLLPCVASLPAGWTFDGASIRSDRAILWLDSDVAGHRAVQVMLRREGGCDVSGATPVPSDEPGARRFEHATRLTPSLITTRTYLFDGGCVTYRFSFRKGTTAALMFSADQALAFEPRSTLVDKVRATSGLALCGVGAECPGGQAP